MTGAGVPTRPPPPAPSAANPRSLSAEHHPPHPFRLEIHESLPSTSDHCIAAAHAGAPEHLAILARRQTAARGSRGRTWTTGDNNLALSVLLRPNTPAAEAGHWSLLAGLAVIEALTPFVDNAARLQLKWPNDILLDGGKLAGILIDTEATPTARLAWLVIGIGANLTAAPALPDRPTAALPAPPLPEALAHVILANLQSWRIRLHAAGFLVLREAWLARAHPIGTLLTITHPAPARTARFAGLSPTGAVVLATPTGEQTFTAAEITLPSALEYSSQGGKALAPSAG